MKALMRPSVSDEDGIGRSKLRRVRVRKRKRSNLLLLSLRKVRRSLMIRREEDADPDSATERSKAMKEPLPNKTKRPIPLLPKMTSPSPKTGLVAMVRTKTKSQKTPIKKRTTATTHVAVDTKVAVAASSPTLMPPWT